MSQTWLGSLVEMKTNIVVGFALNYGVNLAVLPILWDPAKPAASAFYIGLVFTVVSILRQLVIRRWANRWRWGHAKTATAPPPRNCS